MNQIDFTAIPQPSETSSDDWDPPRHVFFGKKDANGKMEKEPVYTYKPFPAILYKQIDGKIRASIANDPAELAARQADGWLDSPAAFGYVGAPDFETALRLKAEEEAEARRIEAETLKDAAIAASVVAQKSNTLTLKGVKA